jgi:hypothetical protein
VISPHQRVSGCSAVKSWPIRSGASRGRWPATGGAFPGPRMTSSQARGAHQAPDPLAGDPHAAHHELGPDPAHARVAAQLGVDLTDLLGELGIVALPLARALGQPPVVALPGDPRGARCEVLPLRGRHRATRPAARSPRRARFTLRRSTTATRPLCWSSTRTWFERVSGGLRRFAPGVRR